MESMVQLLEYSQETSDGGYIGYEAFSGEKVLSNGDKLTSNSDQDVVIAKYDNVGTIEWYQQISAEAEGYIYNGSITEIENKKYVFETSYRGASADVGNGVCINNYNYGNHSSNMTVIYDNYGNVEYAINGDITKRETQDGGYVLIGEFQQPEITLEENVVLQNKTGYLGKEEECYYIVGFIAKYDSNGNALWNKIIEADDDILINYPVTEERGVLSSLREGTVYYSKELSNGSYMIVGNCNGSSIDFGDGSSEIVLDSGAFFSIYDTSGNIVNARISAVSDIIDVEADGGFVTYGNFYNDIDLKIENNIEHIEGQTQQTGLIVKYDKYGITEWYQIIEEVKSSSTYNSINSIQKMSDGSYISIGEIQYTNENNITNTTMLIIKYDNLMKEVWRNEIGKTNELEYYSNNIYKIIETSDNGYIFYGTGSYRVDNSYKYETILIKLQNNREQEWIYTLEDNGFTNYNKIVEANKNIFVFDDFYVSGTQ